MAASGGEAVIYHGVGTNCLLALLLWTFNNNKSHTTRHEMRPKQGAIFTFYLSDKMAVLPPDPVCNFRFSIKCCSFVK